MSHKYKVIDSLQPTFITLTVIDWVDVFIRSEYTKILDASFNYCMAEKGLQVHAYVYMTSLLHAIVSSNGEEFPSIPAFAMQSFCHACAKPAHLFKRLQ